MKKILVTGSSGYIGSHLCKMLKENNYEVHGLDIKDPVVDIPYYKLDINQLFNVNQDYDAVVHLAALVNVSESQKNPIIYYITNINGTMNVLNKVKCNNFIFASTGAAEMCESAYGISKRAAEDVVTEYCTKHKKQDYTIFRFYNVIGSAGYPPTNPDGLFYKMIESAQTGTFTIFGDDYHTPDGTCVRDYVHVQEICDALMTAIEKPANKIECLGHGVGHTVKEMIHLFEKVNNLNLDIKYGPRRPGDIAISVLTETSTYMKNLYKLEDLLKI